MKRLSLLALIAVIALATLAMPHPAVAGQVNSNVVSTTASITVAESIQLTLTGGPIVIPANGTASNQITVQYAYNLIMANHTQGIMAVGYFTSSSAALTNGTTNVAASALSEQVNSGTWGVCNGAVVNGMGLAGATCPSTNPINQAGIGSGGTGTFSDTYSLKYTGTGLTASGSPYSGTFNVVYFAP